MKKDNFQRSSLAASEVVLKLSGCMMSSNACLHQTTDDLLVCEGDVQCPSVVEGSWRGAVADSASSWTRSLAPGICIGRC